MKESQTPPADTPPASDFPPTYGGHVAARIAERILQRGALTVDELGAIAGVLECSPSDLLSPHLPSGCPDHGITINDTSVGGQRRFEAVCLCGWMSDELVDDDRRIAAAAGRWHLEDVQLAAGVPQVGDIATTAPDPYVGPCPGWCTENPHTIEREPDRKHFGVKHDVALRFVDLEFNRPHGANPDSYSIGFVSLYLQQHDRHRDPVIHTCINDGGPGLDLTLNEAEQLAHVLRELLVNAGRTPR